MPELLPLQLENAKGAWTAWEGTLAAGTGLTASGVSTPRPTRLPFCSAAAISRGPGAGEGLGARPRGSRWAWPAAGAAPAPLFSAWGHGAPRARPPTRRGV